MKSLFLLVGLSVSCLAQGPERCTSPPLLSGALSLMSQSERVEAYAMYSYDWYRQRIFLKEMGSYDNKTFGFHVLLLYQEGFAYKFDPENRTCCKKPLMADFHPLAIPKDAALLGQVVLGSSSTPGAGMLVNTWTGEMQLPRGTAKYMSTVTEFGCIPVSTMFHTDKTGWLLTSFFNTVIGMVDPQVLNPPDFCPDLQVETEDGEDPVTFFSLL